jgi:protoporphyrinogen oxidase
MEQKKTVHIIGAGISGLTAAYELEQAGYHPVIIEKSESYGGRVQTLEIKGYKLDLGFQVLLSAYPLAKQYLNFNALDLRKLESGAQVLVDGKRYKIGDPLRNWKVLLPTVFSDIGSISDKLKVLQLNLVLKKKSIEEIFNAPEVSTLDYLKKFGFSEKIITRFFQPFFAGIFLETELHTSSRMFEFVYKMFGEGFATIPRDGIGAISAQLKEKLVRTTFKFNCEVAAVDSINLILKNGEHLIHDGLIVTSNAAALISNLHEEETKWKSCMCLYFEVDKTSIPSETIALVADAQQLSNNLYAYQDHKGRTILSVTTLKHHGVSEEEVTERIMKEVNVYCSPGHVRHITNFTIDQALPLLQNLKNTSEPSASQIADNIFLAGDVLFNGSLNAAMESGRLAAKGLIEKKSGWFS